MHATGTKPKSVQLHEIDSIGLATPRSVARDPGIQRFEVRVGAAVGTAIDDEIARRHPSHAAAPRATAKTNGAHHGGSSQMPCNAITASAATLPKT